MPPINPVLPLLLFSGGSGVTPLATFTFDPADASPVANPYTDDSGYLLDMAQPLNAIDMVDGAMQIQTNSFGSNFFANRVVTQDTFTLAAGLMQKMVIDRTAGGSNWLQLGMGFYDSAAVTTRSAAAVFVDTEANLASNSTSTATNRILLREGEATSGSLQYALFYISSTLVGLAKRESASVWNLLGTFPEQASVSSLKAAINHSVSHGTQNITDWKIAQLGGLPSQDYGIVTDRLDGTLSASQSFTHGADFSLIVDVDTLGSVSHKIRFAEQDSDNYWEIWFTNTGNYTLRETIDATTYQRASAAAVFSGGERAQLRRVDEEITGWVGDSRAFVYSSASNFKTETAGTVIQVGTGGAMSDLKILPYALSISAQIEAA